jgi:serine/threonine protein kinase/tetratricopeptide (TPR) repeat protein
MTPEEWERIREVVEKALDLPADRRVAMLDDVCSSDPGLRAEVEALLASDNNALSNFLGSPLTEGLRSSLDEIASPAGMQTGQVFAERFELIRKLGEGGMGQVWLAEQTVPVRREVAIKLIRAGMYDEAVLQRFRAERQSLAIMDHPSIAKVFDAGTTPLGQPYFVMEYVPGLPITEYCDQKKLKIRDRLELFIQACEGVQHAHQKAVIHRDLKPANILVVEVDGKPVPRIIDFGLAKATTAGEQSLFTLVGHLVGTPGYMSPEQADPNSRDIDTRTDVYSLGVVLYMLLTGTRPFDTKAVDKLPLDQLIKRLREEDPPSPSNKVSAHKETSSATAKARSTDPRQLINQLRGDLDWIALKALEKDRNRRYSTPSELAADIQHYLSHEAVLAVPPSLRYRARKFARRYRVALATATAFALVLIAAAAVSVRQGIRANREAAAASREAAVAEAVNDFLQNDLLAQAGSSAQAGLNSRPDPDLKVRTALDRAAARIAGKFAKQPEVEASIRETVGQTYRDLGLYPQARQQLEKAQELYRRMLGPDDAKRLKTLARLGRVADLQGNYEDAEALSRQAWEAQRRIIGPEHPDTLASLTSLATAYADDGKYPQAEPLLIQSLEIRRRVLGPAHPDTLSSMNNLAYCYDSEGKYAQAEELLTQTLEIRRRVQGPEHPDTLMAMHNLALVSADWGGNYVQAEALLTQTLNIQKRVLGPEHPDTLRSMNSLASVYQKDGKYAQAEALQTQTLEIQKRVLGPEHPLTLVSMTNLASIFGGEGKRTQAEAVDAEALVIRKRVRGPEHPETLESMINLADDYIGEGKYERAEGLLIQTMKISRRVLGAENPYTLGSKDELAQVYKHEGKYPQAEELYAQLLEVQKHMLGPEHPDTALTLYNLASVAARRGSKAQAFALLGNAVDHGLAPNVDLGMEKDTELTSLYGDPRFAALVAHAKQVAEAKQKATATPTSK